MKRRRTGIWRLSIFQHIHSAYTQNVTRARHHMTLTAGSAAHCCWKRSAGLHVQDRQLMSCLGGSASARASIAASVRLKAGRTASAVSNGPTSSRCVLITLPLHFMQFRMTLCLAPPPTFVILHFIFSRRLMRRSSTGTTSPRRLQAGPNPVSLLRRSARAASMAPRCRSGGSKSAKRRSARMRRAGKRPLRTAARAAERILQHVVVATYSR